MLLTPTYRHARAAFRLKLAMGLAVGACLWVFGPPPAAAQEEEGAGFFQYFPAPPKLNLPEITIPFWTDEVKKGRKLYRKGEYENAALHFRKASEEGSPVADWYLAHMFRLGLGVKRDHAIAHSYYERVVNGYSPDELNGRRLQIVVDSQLRLANYTRHGIKEAGIEANPERAAKQFLRIASNYGHPSAQYALGVMNLRGEGMKKNEQQGLKWLTAAAKKRDPEAEAYLGELYWSGKTVRKSETRALMWYVLAKQNARPDEHARIMARYEELNNAVEEEVRLEAEARARIWAEQYPAINSGEATQ